MAQKQIPDIETTLDRNEVKSSEDYRLVRDTSTGSDVKTPAGSAGGYDVGSGADEVPTNGDVESAVSTHADKESDVHGAPDGEKLLNTADSDYRAMPIGIPFGVWDHLAGIDPPSNDGTAKFVRLTAGEDGSGEYNEGLLTNESVSGSAPLVEATAEIDYADSPIDGETIHLINTERRYLMPGESSGTIADDQMQQITGDYSQDATDRAATGLSNAEVDGAFSIRDEGINRPLLETSSNEGGTLVFDSANSPNARTGDHTNVKHIESTWYLRIA